MCSSKNMDIIMRQTTLAEDSFAKYKKETRKEKFLSQMDQIIPWRELTKIIKPFYPKPEGSGRRPIGVERALRIHFMQHGFNLSDPAMEDALYDIASLRSFTGIDLGREPAPDETTILKFRHLLESHNLGEELFHLVNEYLTENGLFVAKGTIVDATIIDAPTSAKNKDKKRDEEMHQTRKEPEADGRTKGAKSKQIESSFKGRTCIPCDEAPIWVYQSPIQRA